MMSSRAMAQLQRERDFMRTADIVNKFIISTAQFLNRFAAQCDNKLLETSRSLQRLEALTVLLESKLNSIDEEYGEERDAMTAAPPPTAALVSGSLAPPAFADRNAPPPMPGLVAVQSINRPPPPPPQRHGPPPPPGATLQARTGDAVTVQLAAPSLLLPPPPVLPGQPPSGYVPPPPPPMPLLGGFTMATHPRLKGYFEMLALRVPIAAVKAKMMADGHEPGWLDTPDAVAPPMLGSMSGVLDESD